MFGLASYNFYISTSIMKLEMSICVISDCRFPIQSNGHNLYMEVEVSDKFFHLKPLSTLLGKVPHNIPQLFLPHRRIEICTNWLAST